MSGMVQFNRVTIRLPDSVVNSVEETVLQRLYEHARLRFGEFDTIHVESGCGPFTVEVPTADHIYKISQNSESGYEPELRRRLSTRLDATDTFYDIGGAYGYFSSLAIACGVEPGDVHVFEADWYRAQILNRTHRGEGVKITNKFVGSNASDGTIVLDEYVESESPPSVMKIDVEGAEKDVLDGMSQTLETATPTLFVECHPEMISGGVNSLEAMVEKLREFNYKFEILDHRSQAGNIIDQLP